MTALYRLDGRRLEGSLQEPTRNDTVTAESDDWAALRQRAESLARQGFTVWIYDHGHRSPFPHASDLRVIEVLRPPTDGGARP